jgi:general secretion pathway protein D
MITLLALALLLAGCESTPEAVSHQAQEPDGNEPVVEEALSERAVPTSVVAEPNAVSAILACGAVDTTACHQENTSPATDLGHRSVTPHEPPQPRAARQSDAQDSPAGAASIPHVRVIQPVGKAIDRGKGSDSAPEDIGLGSSARSASAIDRPAKAAPGTDPMRTTIENCPPPGSDAPADSPQSPDRQDYQPAALANADEVVKLDLPPQMDMIQLLDLVGEYLQLDYLYDPEKIKGQVVTLKLHGKLQGQVRVRELYLLLESVLKFKGFAMICHEGNLVTIVPAADALKANPDLIDPTNRTVEAGDMVVTSVLDLHHVSVSAATTLLQSMQLSLAVTPVEGTQVLIVTCYAHQMQRIERLLSLVDRPGTPREFRFRQLKYTLADSLTRKVQMLIPKLGSVSSAAGATGPTFSPRPGGPSAGPGKSSPPVGGSAPSDDSVYLDADERTNRILMIGPAQPLAIVEKLVDSLDVAQQDLRVLKIYDVQHVDAQEIKRKLQELEILGDNIHARATSAGPAGKVGSTEIAEAVRAERPVVVVLEATNSLVVNATQEQHAQVEAMMTYLDAPIRTETIPYEIYFLENQNPENIAQVLEKIIHETVPDKDGKLQKIVRNTEEQIVIVPDKGSFSLIVYATRKNQEWISKLIQTLDLRRPQVLIDVTLVEIRKTDEFNYDLNLITSIPDLVETGGQTKQFNAGQNTTVVDKLQQTGRSRFVDFEVDSGTGTGFYADKHINALLRAVLSKNYGRVLAKPKVLVNDNEKGTIKTADTTYVVTRSSIPVTSGSAGQQSTLIETAVKYEPYDAGIKLEITPHISNKVLRLETTLSRSDFTSATAEKPPDKTSSDITTIVTVPDRSTIILGGMLKLNQTKAGKKVPILGDLPIVGGLFRSISNSDIQSKLYVFVRAEIIRPTGGLPQGKDDLEIISERNREAFEKHELEFQNHRDWPGIKPKPVDPKKVLEVR